MPNSKAAKTIRMDKDEVRSATVACRFCGTELLHTFVDLGMSPLANSYLAPAALNRGEVFYPLHARVCKSCLLVQLEEFASPADIFGDYAYFSSYSGVLVENARRFAEAVIPRFGLGKGKQVIEVASNDGYLLQHFVGKGVGVLGIEPARNVALEARKRGIKTMVRFFGEKMARKLAEDGKRADLLIGNNVLAHVPNLNDFVRGLKVVLAEDGVLTMEFPHILRLIQETEFDTIYHEHFSYFSFLTAEKVFLRHGLSVFDVEEIDTHGGSLRVFAQHDTQSRPVEKRVRQMEEKERAAGLDSLDPYVKFGERVLASKRQLLGFLVGASEHRKKVACYGAPAKATTLLNYCGINGDLVEYTVDHSPHKQGRFLPGTHLPIHSPEMVRETKPDYLLLLAWNLRDEIMEQMAHVRKWGCKFVIPLPVVQILS